MDIEKRNILESLAPEQRSRLVGDITLLMATSRVHRAFPVVDLMDVVLPPVHLNQFRIYHNKNKTPIGLATWGFFTNDVLERYLAGDVVLTLDEWKNGDRLVFTDFIAPYGHAKLIVHDLRNNIFPQATGCSIRFDAAGKPRKKVRHWHGALVSTQKEG